MKKWVSLSLCIVPQLPARRRHLRDDAWMTNSTNSRCETKPIRHIFCSQKVTTRMIFQNTQQETSRVPPRTRESYNCFEQKSIDDDDDDDAFCLRWIQTPPPPPPPPTRGNEDECLFWGRAATTFKLSRKRSINKSILADVAEIRAALEWMESNWIILLW